MRNDGKWMLAALLIPVMQAASGTSWYWVLGISAVCGLLCYGVKLDIGEEPGWVKAVQWIWSTWILAEMLFRSGSCWPGGEQTTHIPLLLLILSGMMAIKGRERNQQAAGALWWMLLLLLIPVGLRAAALRDQCALHHSEAFECRRNDDFHFQILCVCGVYFLLAADRSLARQFHRAVHGHHSGFDGRPVCHSHLSVSRIPSGAQDVGKDRTGHGRGQAPRQGTLQNHPKKEIAQIYAP